MKKAISIILLALVMLAGLTQCKKNDSPNASGNEGNKVHITLNVKRSNDARLDIDPPHVNFENGDRILVASNGVYVGCLEYNGTNFDGEISSDDAVEDQPLYFYLMGNLTPEETLTEGSTTSCSVVISDQTTNKPVIACAPSNENFGTTNSFTSTLRNKCALVKFSVTTSSTSATSIKGFNNKVTVNFATNTLTPSKEGDGVITLPAGNGEHWAILLPQEAMEAGNEGSATSADGYYSGTVGAVPTIDNNAYLTFGIPVTVNTYVVPVGALGGLFSVSDTTLVYFSRCNLSYNEEDTESYWAFDGNQWDHYRNMYGWGTSGYNHGATCYQPLSTGILNGQYYAYGNQNYNLYDQTGQADWGYNAIVNGGNQENSGWRTPTKDEWVYVISGRADAASKWSRGIVNGVKGIILLPDYWMLPEGLSFTAGIIGWNDANVYTAEQWAQMEANSAVFLPAAGRLMGGGAQNVGSYGYYWSSSVRSESRAFCLDFTGSNLNPGSSSYRYYGHSVRLVRNAE